MADIENLALDEVPTNDEIYVPVDLDTYTYLIKETSKDPDGQLESRFIDQLVKILARRGSLKEASWDLNYLNISINHPADAITEILAALEALLPGMFLKLEADIARGGNRCEFFTRKYEDRRVTEKEELTGGSTEEAKE